MYRQYEKSKSLEKQIERIRNRMKKTTDEYELLSLHEDLEDLEQRLNQSYQDEEY